MIKRICCSLLGAFLVMIIFWIGGMDFDHRSADVAFVITLAIYVFGCVYLLGDWKK